MLGERWARMSVEQRNHVLSRSLGAVFVRKGRGVLAGRIKVLTSGFELLGRVRQPPAK
jgi:hypothetical protein